MKPNFEQTSLFSSFELAAGSPNRATTKHESDFIVAIRKGIQDYVESGGDITVPITFDIDFRQLAIAKNVKSWHSLYQSFENVFDDLTNIPLNVTVNFKHNTTKNQGFKKATYWLLSSVKQNQSKGLVRITINKEYQDFYIENVLGNPAFQMDYEFHEQSSSAYTYPFYEWLSARVAEEKFNDAPYPYRITVSYEEMRKRVPTPVNQKTGKFKLASPNDYKRNVILKAIEDINSSPKSQFKILNPDEITTNSPGQKLTEFVFIVALNAAPTPLIPAKSTFTVFDEYGVPGWDYLARKMESLGFGKTSIAKYQSQPAKVWRAILETCINLGKLQEKGTMPDSVNTGGYLRTLLKSKLSDESFKALATKIVLRAPQYRDDVIDAASSYDPIFEPLKIAESIREHKEESVQQTPENNGFLRDWQEKHGVLPGGLK